MRDGFISMGHGRAIINVEDVQDQLHIYEQIIREKLSVRQTEELVKNLKTPNKTKPKKNEIPKYIKDHIQEINTFFGHSVAVTVGANGKGKLTIPFHSEEDFNRIKKLLK